MHPSRPRERRVRAESLRGYPLEPVARALGYRSDPDNAVRWRRPGSVLSINRFMFYDHLRAEEGAGAIELAVHALGCTPPDAIDFLAELSDLSMPPGGRRQAPAKDPRWPNLRRYLVERRGLADALVTLCRDLGLVHADPHGNPVFVRRNAAGEATGIETVTADRKTTAGGGFWMSWETEWPHAVILDGNALDALSILSLHLGPVKRTECATVSTGAVATKVPKWIEAWNPRLIFCAYDATTNGDHAARRLARNDTRIVRLRPALDNRDWNDMLIRDRAGEPIETDDQQIN